MAEAALRAAVKAALTALPSIGVVHDYSRWSIDPATFLALFQEPATKRIFGWEVSRPSARVEWLDEYHARVRHTLQVDGYLGLQDAAGTEKLFAAAVDVVLGALLRLDLSAAGAEAKPKPAPVVAVDTRLFGGVLCHHAELKWEVAEVLEPAEAAGLDDFLTFAAAWDLAAPDGTIEAADTVTLEGP